MFKKILSGIKNFFFKMTAKPLIDEGGDQLEVWLRQIATKRPKLFRILVAGCHTAAKEYGPAWVLSTANDLDDAGLEEFLDALETVAAEFGLDLDHEAEELKEDTGDTDTTKSTPSL